MRSPSGNNRAQFAELLNLAATIDQQVRLAQLSGTIREGLSFISMYTLFDAVPASNRTAPPFNRTGPKD
jgi:hypothetical protein